ncbi:hypothetical protein NDI76_16875 [Halogeometricum sp. S1BR25-6]|uniref:Uncharacterized protein n=1 Tax=Halogeometricum salsisoli TaxID=2950536 RepID=A0ABU2GHX4_9EURY|nr:hypothetical protein [Halogeometricum sp. S1BR25-6]MDS0300423.1 hypothetical protein [Halogeometricum sp. S1BR25-6]
MSPPLRQRSTSSFPKWARVLLLVGFLAVAGAVLAARSNPATGYEVSIYRATPVAFWVGVLAAATIGVVVALYAGRWGRITGVGLAGFATMSFAALPFFRGYYYYGTGDALTHLGWAKQMLGPDFGFFDIIYPGGHSLALFLSQTMGVPVRWGMMYAMLTVSLVTLVFVPLAVWVVLPEPRAVVIAAFSAMLMMPINNISTHPHFHAYTLTTLYFPFVLYLLFKHLTRSAEDASLPEWLSAASLVLPVAVTANVFFHPQVAVNVLVFMGTVLAVGLMWRRHVRVSHPAATDGGGQHHRLLAGQVLFLFALLVAWAAQYRHTYIYARNILASAMEFLQTGSGAGQAVGRSGGSAQSIGVSLTELFAKLFLVNTAYIVLAGGLVAAIAYGVIRERYADSNAAVTYIGASALTLGPLFAATFVGDVSEYFFRHLGFAMILVAVVGSIALYHLSERLDGTLGEKAKPVLVVVVVVTMCLSLVTFFPSPYMYHPTSHSTEQQFVGYDATLEHRAEGAAIAGIRHGPGRFTDALNDPYDLDLQWSLSGPVASSVENVTHYRGSSSERPFYYLVVSEVARDREVLGFKELRYTSEDFERIEQGANPRLSLVQTNGEFATYYVNQRGYSLEPTETTEETV